MLLCVWVGGCVCVGVYVCGCEYKICVHCIRAASRILDRGGRIGEMKNVGGAKLSEIICLLMNLTDPRGGGGRNYAPPQSSPVKYVRVTSVNCI